MKPTSASFPENAKAALADPGLQRSMAGLKRFYMGAIGRARANLPEFEALRDAARAMKAHTFEHLDLYLEEYERKVVESGGKIHWATTPAEARTIILRLCQEAGARRVTKGKSMISEEIALNDHLEKAGLEVTETDLGEYLIQLRKEPPSHIIGPAVHLTREQIVEDFRRAHRHLPEQRPLDTAEALVGEARQILRERFLAADVGITGANLLVAETGTSIIVTNEGNGDLTQTLPGTHIVIASIEKVVPTLEDAMTILRILARSATGQEMSTYTTFSTGPRRPGDPDGPANYHVVLLDGGRSELLGTELAEALKCIRCGACMDHCPVYHAVGGHAYGWVYPGPIGAVLTPTLIGIEAAGHLPNASSFCGRCEEVCPMRIPLPAMMRHYREKEFTLARASTLPRRALAIWAWIAQRPRLYHRLARIGVAIAAWTGGRAGRFQRLPMAHGWTDHRNLAAPEGGTFQARWRRHQKRQGRSP